VEHKNHTQKAQTATTKKIPANIKRQP